MGYRNGTWLFREVTPRSGGYRAYETQATGRVGAGASSGARTGVTLGPRVGASAGTRPRSTVGSAVRSGGQSTSPSRSSGGGGTGSAVRRGGQSTSPNRSSGGSSSSGSGVRAGASSGVSVGVGFNPSTGKFTITPPRSSGGGTTTTRTPTVPANTMFGSYRIADLQKMPFTTKAQAVRNAAMARQLAPLKLLQTREGQSLYIEGQKMERLTEEYRRARYTEKADPRTLKAIQDQIIAQGTVLMDRYESWILANAGAATAANQPVSDERAKYILNYGLKGGFGVPGGVPTTVDQLTRIFEKGGSWAAAFTAAGNVASDVAIGCASGKCPSMAELGNSIGSNAVGMGFATSIGEFKKAGQAFPGVGSFVETVKTNAPLATRIAGKIAGTAGNVFQDLPITVGLHLSNIFTQMGIAEQKERGERMDV